MEFDMNDKKYGTGDTFTDWAVVILSIILFTRTADVLSYFSPPILNEVTGWDVAWIYGGVTAFFVEGVALAFHFNRRAKNHTPAQIVKWVLLAISGICQVFDGNIILGTLNQMPEAQRMAFQIGVPLLPLFVVVLLFFVGHLPDDVNPAPFKGFKNYLPDWKRMWHGDDYKNTRVFSESMTLNQDVRQTKKISSKNGKKPEAEDEPVNP
jgi:hypothetical protein